MSKKLLVFVVVLVGLALGGIVLVQMYYIKNAYNQNAINFDQKVETALSDLVDKLEQTETVEIIHEQLRNQPLNKRSPNKFKYNYTYSNTPRGISDSIFIVEFKEPALEELILAESKFNIQMNIELDDEDIVFFGENKNGKWKSERKTTQKKPKTRNKDNGLIECEEFTILEKDSGGDYVIITVDNGHEKVVKVERKKIDKKAHRIKTVIDKMVTEKDVEFNEYRKQLKFGLIDSLLDISLLDNSIMIPYEYSVISNDTSETKLPSSKKFNKYTDVKKYETRLFPGDIIPKNEKLVILFPEREDHLLKSLSLLLPSSLLFSLIIIVAFAISIRMMLKQKKISDIKSDFINNMTHEFKTPIATISLAADTVVNPKIINDKEKIQHFVRIIKEENKRMNTQVERVLQMSLLDKSDFELNRTELDVHHLIQNVLNNLNVQLNKKNAKVNLSLNSEKSTLFIDEIHFTNVVNNLIDNALKYSNGSPVLTIATELVNAEIKISIKDNGIGMNKEAQSKVFDKFYRVTTGNIHNIKGFGLGLSYVKAIINAHEGRIILDSEPGKGSRFDIFMKLV